MVADAPVKETASSSEANSISRHLPVHKAGIKDGGPVIGSGLVVSKDPDTGQRNVSFHRLQIKGPDKSGILLYPRHTLEELPEVPGAQRADAGGDLHRPPPALLRCRGHHGRLRPRRVRDRRRLPRRGGAPGEVRHGRPRSARRRRDRARRPSFRRITARRRGRSRSSRTITSPAPARTRWWNTST